MLPKLKNHEDNTLQLPSSSNQTIQQQQQQQQNQQQLQEIPKELHLVTKDGEQCLMWRSNQLTYIAPNRKEFPLVLAKKFGHLATKLDLSYNNLTSFRNINLFTNLNELILDNNCLEDDELQKLIRQNLRLKTLSLNKNKLCDLSKLIIKIKVCFPNLEFLSLIGNPFCPIKILPTANEQTSANTTTTRAFDLVANSARPWRRYNSIEATGSCEQYFTSVSSSYRKEDEEGTSSKNFSPDLTVATTTTTTSQLDFNDESSMVVVGVNVGGDDSEQYQETYLANQRYRYFIINHLPNLHFLDSSLINEQERDEALNSCFWVENFLANDGRIKSIIWGQTINTMHQEELKKNKKNSTGCNLPIYHYNIDDIIRREPTNSSQMLAIQSKYELDNKTNKPNGQEDQQQQQQQQQKTIKGQFSQQVKCQMVGSFAFARTLLWTFLSLTSTNLVHCSGSILALSLKGIGGSSGRGRKFFDKRRNHKEEQ